MNECEIWRMIGRLEAKSEICISDREEMLPARKEIFHRLDQLEGLINKITALIQDMEKRIEEIDSRVQKMEMAGNRVIGAAGVISIVIAILGQFIFAWLQK